MARGRPRVFDSTALLAAARDVFLRHGVNATTEEVAAKAGVSEGLLYHRFGNKERLFREAMQLPEGSHPECLEKLPTEIDPDVGAVLQRTAVGLIEWATMEMPLVMMSWSSQGGQSLRSRLQAANDPPLRQHRVVRDYLERMRLRGALAQSADTDAMAFAFLGGVRGFVFLNVVYGERGSRRNQTAPEFAEALARLLVPSRPVENPTRRKREEVRRRIASKPRRD